MARELQHGMEPFPASHGDVYRVRTMDVNTPVDNFDAVIASHGSGLLAKIRVAVRHADSRKHPRVMGIPLHPMLIGQPLRIKYLQQAIAYMKKHERVWFATAGEIVDAYESVNPVS